MKRKLIVLTMVLIGVFSLPVSGSEQAPSLLSPASGFRKDFSMRLDNVDPGPQDNPGGAGKPGFRGDHQLVVYTSASGATTETGEPGLEAVVSGGTVTGWVAANAAIPLDGLVISGHGNGANWMRKILKPGAVVEVDMAGRRLHVTHTPAVYVHQVQQALARLKAHENPENPDTAKLQERAFQCLNRLIALQDRTLTPEIVDLAESCERDATTAYYRSLQPWPEGFRGVWLRPSSARPEVIARLVAELKTSGIRDVFLETYYQGKTLYPSQVMAEAGLPEQHAQFQGGDPMQLWVDEAHRQGLRVHAWMQVFFAGNARENIETYGPILQKYPQWRNVQRLHWNAGHPVPSGIEPGHYFLDPANAEVRAFLESLILETVSRYPVDGLNLDYIRYPSSAHPDKPTYLQSTWGYTETARRQFQALVETQRRQEEARKAEAAKKAGLPAPKPVPANSRHALKTDPKDLTPQDPLWPQWITWRKQQISSFVREVSAKAQSVRPGLSVSAVVFPPSDPDLVVKLQDWPQWIREGSVHALTPIGLTGTPQGIYEQSMRFRDLAQGKAAVYVGIFGLYNRIEPVDLVTQIEAVYKAGGQGIILFDGARLAPEYRDALLEGPFRLE